MGLWSAITPSRLTPWRQRTVRPSCFVAEVAAVTAARSQEQGVGMRVRIDIGLDFEGLHTFRWEPSETPGAIDVPRATLDRWTAEQEAFRVAHLRWKRVAEEVEDYLFEDGQVTESQEALPSRVAAGG